MKKTLLAAAIALSTTFASAAPVSIAFDADDTAAFWSKPAAGSFTDEYVFTVPYQLSALSASVTTSIVGNRDIDFSRVYLTDGSSTLFNFLQTSTDATGSEQWALTDAPLLAGINYHLFLEGSSAATGALYAGELSVMPASAVPEPGSVALVLAGLGAAGLVGWRRRRA
ncbi:PEP-CTERM sorting domain-containing protein [Aquincola tertiaricarbonis]|uniref:PEP-CTERM sorting domain-containing protein n=1 Tax=Aquincola tertiaricarbonis TaxID=391953 RepID=A0ABY4S847_AQUTE|nr:FxDxF family PEP-CTERM protein [Aquincola tertiaricarbonis]URI08067.1 PEP-CTERM sorting domain-containing protein [Aquincola tertiaricarbonis]